MKVIMVMFDSLNRRMLPPYGCDWTHMPNFSRLAQHAATFDREMTAHLGRLMKANDAPAEQFTRLGLTSTLP